MKQIRGIFFILFALISENREVVSLSLEEQEICKNHYMEKLQNPTDETKYIVCSDSPIGGACVQGASHKICYDEISGKCSKDACAKGSDNPKYKKSVKEYCIANNYFLQPYPALDCEHYYMCTNEGSMIQALYMPCPKDQHYSLENKSCMPFYQAGCESLEEHCAKQSDGFKFPVDKDNCYQFYECIRGKPALMSCELSEQFDEIQHACVKSSNSMRKCADKKPHVPNCSFYNNGDSFSHYKCNKFYICIEGDALEAQCESGFYYNKTTKFCTESDKLNPC